MKKVKKYKKGLDKSPFNSKKILRKIKKNA